MSGVTRVTRVWSGLFITKGRCLSYLVRSPVATIMNCGSLFMDKKIAWDPQYGFRDPGFASYLKARIRDAIRD